MIGYRTRWTIRALDDLAGYRWAGLRLTLSVDTTAEAIVDAIESGARAAGVELEREPAPDRSTSPERAAGSPGKGTR